MKKAYIYILLSTVLFSTMEIMLKITSSDYNPVQLTFLRFLIGTIILFPLAVKGLNSRNCHLKMNDFLFFSATGFICIVISMIFFQLAVMYSEASVVAVLFSCNPVFVIVFAFFILHQKIHRHTVISLIISLAGITVLINPLHMTGSVTGFVLSILSAVTFALYGVIGTTRSERYGSVALTCFSFLFGSAEMFILILITRIHSVAAFLNDAGFSSFANVPIFHGIIASSIPSLLYIGVCVTGLGYTFYFLAMEKSSAATASIVFFIKPALAPILALIILHEAITPSKGAGILLILTGSLISLIAGLKTPQSKSPKLDAAKDI